MWAQTLAWEQLRTLFLKSLAVVHSVSIAFRDRHCLFRGKHELFFRRRAAHLIALLLAAQFLLQTGVVGSFVRSFSLYRAGGTRFTNMSENVSTVKSPYLFSNGPYISELMLRELSSSFSPFL